MRPPFEGQRRRQLLLFLSVPAGSLLIAQALSGMTKWTPNRSDNRPATPATRLGPTGTGCFQVKVACFYAVLFSLLFCFTHDQFRFFLPTKRIKFFKYTERILKLIDREQLVYVDEEYTFIILFFLLNENETKIAYVIKKA